MLADGERPTAQQGTIYYSPIHHGASSVARVGAGITQQVMDMHTDHTRLSQVKMPPSRRGCFALTSLPAGLADTPVERRVQRKEQP